MKQQADAKRGKEIIPAIKKGRHKSPDSIRRAFSLLKEEYQQSRELYESILNGLTCGIWATDARDVIFYANKGMEMIAGVTRQKLRGYRVLEDSSESAIDYFRQYYGEAKETLRPVHYSEVPIVTPAGRQTYQSGWLIPRVAGDAYNGMICILEDITNEKDIRKALRESEAKYGELVENVNSIIFRLDLEGHITFINKFGLKYFGFRQDEIICRSVIGTIVPNAAKATRAVGSMLRNIGKSPWRYLNNEFENVRKDGTEVWIAWTNKAILNDRGEITEILCVGNDITDLKHSERLLKQCRSNLEKQVKVRTSQLTRTNEELHQEIEERRWVEEVLRKSEQKYRLVVENANEAIAIIQDGFIKYINPKGSKITGFTKEDLTSLPFTDLFHPDERDMLRERFLKRLKGDSVPSLYAARIIDREGNIKWLEINSVLITLMGRPATLSFFSNITERKKAEESVRVYQEQLRSLASELSLAEEKERRRIATDLHDHIGQTLAIAKLKLGALRDQLASCGCDDRLSEVRSLLEQSIKYTKSLTFELSPPILYELGFEATIEWLGEQVQKQHNITFAFDSDEHSTPLDRNTSILLFQAVRELFMNVVKHSGARHMVASIRREQDNIQVVVGDDGIGFDPERIEKNTFGFFSIRERLNNFGGDFEIWSRPGHGTKVMLTAPISGSGAVEARS